MSFKVSETVTLPVGLLIKGQRYTEVVIEEMILEDQSNLASKSVRNNGAKAMDLILRRCIQEIPGLLPRKSRKTELIKDQYVKQMLAPDRDFLFIAIRALGMDDSLRIHGKCPSCGEDNNIDVVIEELEVLEWDFDEAPEPHIEIDLPKGIMGNDGKRYKKVFWKFLNGSNQAKLAALPPKKQTAALMASSMFRVEGMEETVDSEMVRTMSLRDQQYLMRQVYEMTPGVDLRQETECLHCEHEWIIDIDVKDFFSSEEENPKKTSKGGKNGGKSKRKGLRRR